MTSDLASLRIVVVEDEKMFRQMLVHFLRRICGCAVAGEAADGVQGLELCLAVKPNVALIDLELPVMDGLAMADRLHRQAPDIKLLALSCRLDAFTVYRVDHSPFQGFVDKGEEQAVLKQALLRVKAGQRSFSDKFVALRARLSRDPNSFVKILSPREIDILACIADGKSNTDIAEQMGIAMRTVETHRHRMMKKLHLANGAALEHFARDQGFESLTLPEVLNKPAAP